MEYSFNPNAEPRKRVQSIKVGGSDIDMKKKYTVACRSRIGFGQGLSTNFSLIFAMENIAIG